MILPQSPHWLTCCLSPPSSPLWLFTYLNMLHNASCALAHTCPSARTHFPQYRGFIRILIGWILKGENLRNRYERLLNQLFLCKGTQGHLGYIVIHHRYNQTWRSLEIICKGKGHWPCLWWRLRGRGKRNSLCARVLVTWSLAVACEQTKYHCEP